MRLRVLLLFLAIPAILAMAACGDDDPTATSTTAPTATATSSPTGTATAPATATATATGTAVTSPTIPAEGAVVAMAGFAFNPQSITVSVGTTVSWTNADAAPHRPVGTSEGGFDAGTANQGETVTFTFEEAGTFPYICEIHPNMTGEVIVQ
jgi:plastocyanin